MKTKLFYKFNKLPLEKEVKYSSRKIYRKRNIVSSLNYSIFFDHQDINGAFEQLRM